MKESSLRTRPGKIAVGNQPSKGESEWLGERGVMETRRLPLGPTHHPEILGMSFNEAISTVACYPVAKAQWLRCGCTVGGELGLTRAGFCQVSAM